MRKPADEALLKALATEVKARRHALGLSQDELGHLAGLNRTFIGKIEVASSQPSLTAFFRLSQALQASVVDLIGSIDKRRQRELSPKKRT